MLNRKLPALLLALSPALLLTACGGDEVKSTRDPVRFERVPLPMAPAGEAVCPDQATSASHNCLSDRQLGELLNAVIDVACEANDRIAWLSDYYLKSENGPTCPAPKPGS